MGTVLPILRAVLGTTLKCYLQLALRSVPTLQSEYIKTCALKEHEYTRMQLEVEWVYSYILNSNLFYTTGSNKNNKTSRGVFFLLFYSHSFR